MPSFSLRSKVSKIRPRISETFDRKEKLGIYMQVYNFGTDEGTNKPSGTLEYEVTRNGKNDKVLEFTEDVNSRKGASAQQVTSSVNSSTLSFLPFRVTSY